MGNHTKVTMVCFLSMITLIAYISVHLQRVIILVLTIGKNFHDAHKNTCILQNDNKNLHNHKHKQIKKFGANLEVIT